MRCLALLAVIGCRPHFVDNCGSVDIAPGGRVACEVPGYVDRAFDLYVPASWDRAAALPLVVAFHGGGGNRESAERVTCSDGVAGGASCLVQQATARGYAVVLPDGTGSRPLRDVRTWNAGGGGPGAYCASGHACAMNVDDVGYFDDLLVEIRSAIPIDARRVYATGLSNGAAISHRLACERSSVIAAIAPVGGANQHADGGGNCDGATVLHVHGTADECWPYEGGAGDCLEKSGRKTSVAETMAGWAARNGCAGTVTETAIADRDPGDGITSLRRTWTGCAHVTELVVIEGGGHTWPSGWQYFGTDAIGRVTRDFGNELILDFFDAHPKP